MADSNNNSPPFTLRESPNRRIGLDETITMRAGLFRAKLVGGFFDDPTIYLEHVHGSRAMLLDLGEMNRYPVRVLNRVDEVFVTHAHTDHFAGFVTLLRTRVHNGSTCRIFGPPDLADRVESLVDGFTWDRLEDGEGPSFVVCELHGDEVRRWEIRAGTPRRRSLPPRPAPDGLLFEEPRFRVRACQVDHGTPVLAYAVEERENYAVRSDRLESPYEPGPWIGEMKEHFARGALDARVELPDGNVESVDTLADEFLLVTPGEKLVYATDFADNPTNRRRVVELARDADIFICEAFYARADAAKADEFGHLTTKACAEIARDAGVGRLVPFHFSARYDDEPEVLYAEILEIFQDVEVPAVIGERLER